MKLLKEMVKTVEHNKQVNIALDLFKRNDFIKLYDAKLKEEGEPARVKRSINESYFK